MKIANFSKKFVSLEFYQDQFSAIIIVFGFYLLSERIPINKKKNFLCPVKQKYAYLGVGYTFLCGKLITVDKTMQNKVCLLGST